MSSCAVRRGLCPRKRGISSLELEGWESTREMQPGIPDRNFPSTQCLDGPSSMGMQGHGKGKGNSPFLGFSCFSNHFPNQQISPWALSHLWVPPSNSSSVFPNISPKKTSEQLSSSSLCSQTGAAQLSIRNNYPSLPFLGGMISLRFISWPSSALSQLQHHVRA